MSTTSLAIRVVTAILGALFLLSCVLNFGLKVPPLSFSAPSSTVAEFEVVIGLVLLAAAVLSWAYAYAGALLLATVGVLEGLLNGEVQGQARGLHEAVTPFLALGWVLLAAGARSSIATSRARGADETRQGLVTALQIFVGALVTLGGAAFAALGTYPVGTALGMVHLAVGLGGLVGGYAIYNRKPWARGYLIWINVVTIVYSAFAETLAEAYSYLPPGINDSLIGTIVAIAVSVEIVYLLRNRN